MRLFKRLCIVLGMAFASIFSCAITTKSFQTIESQNIVHYANKISADTSISSDQKFKFSPDKENQEAKFIIGVSSSYSFHVIKLDPTFDKEPKVSMDSLASNISLRQDGNSNAYIINYSSNSADTAAELEIRLSYIDENGQDIPQDILKISLVEKPKTLWDWVMGILSSAVGTTLSVTALFTVLWRSALKVYEKGKNDKKELVSKQELKDFEADTRKDMRGYVRQITETVTDSAMRIIEKELKPLDDVVAMSNEMKVTKQQIDSDLKLMNDKYDEIKQIGDTVRSLSTKVTRIEYGQEASNERRTER